MEAAAPISDIDVERLLVDLYDSNFEDLAKRANTVVTDYFESNGEALPSTLRERIVLRLTREGSLFESNSPLYTRVVQTMNRLVKSHVVSPGSDHGLHESKKARPGAVDPTALLQAEVRAKVALAKQRFLAMTSHELKTPLQGIIGGVEMALDVIMHGRNSRDSLLGQLDAFLPRVTNPELQDFKLFPVKYGRRWQETLRHI